MPGARTLKDIKDRDIVGVIGREQRSEDGCQDDEHQDGQCRYSKWALQEPPGEMAARRAHVGRDIGGHDPADSCFGHDIRAFGFRNPCRRSMTRLTTMTITPMATTRPMTRGTSPSDVARTATWPRPGMPKTSSMITAPPRRPTNDRARTDRAGPPAFRRTCLNSTLRSETPRLRRVRTQSWRSASMTELRTCWATPATRPIDRAITGRVTVLTQPEKDVVSGT